MLQGPALCGACWSRFISSQTHRLNPHWASPLSCSPRPHSLSGFCKFHGLSLALTFCLISPAPLPATLLAWLLSSFLPTRHTYRALSCLFAVAQAIPWAWSTLSISPFTGFTPFLAPD